MLNNEKQHRDLSELTERAQREADRLKRLSRGDEEVLRVLAPLVRSYVLASIRADLNDDQWQECQVAILQSWRTYDAKKGAFLHWCGMAIRKALARMPRTDPIHMPVYLRALIAKVIAYEEQAEAQSGVRPSEGQICRALQINAETLANVRLAGRAAYCHDLIDAYSVAERSDDSRVDLHVALERLASRSAEIARLVRLVHLEGCTEAEAAKITGLHRRQVQRRLAVGLRYLRMAMKG